MESSQVKNIIQTFFDKKVSKNTLALFAKWFRLDTYTVEKEEAMEVIWENSPSVVDKQILDDLAKIKLQINQKTLPKDRVWLRRALPYAAAISIIVLSTFFLTYKFAVPAPLEYTQLSVSYGEGKKITLPDGTLVVVNAGSTLIYPKDFTSDTRTVFLSGEANFDIAKNPEKPFIVKTKYIDVQALGTQFHVQAYPNSRQTKVSLIEGKVKVETEENKERSYILKPNTQLIYSHNDDKISIIDVDAERFASWQDGYLIFQDASFEDIVQAIERKYKVAINYNGRGMNDHYYHVKFNPDDSLNEVLETLTILVHKSKYEIRGNTVYFHAE